MIANGRVLFEALSADVQSSPASASRRGAGASSRQIESEADALVGLALCARSRRSPDAAHVKQELWDGCASAFTFPFAFASCCSGLPLGGRSHALKLVPLFCARCLRCPFKLPALLLCLGEPLWWACCCRCPVRACLRFRGVALRPRGDLGQRQVLKAGLELPARKYCRHQGVQRFDSAHCCDLPVAADGQLVPKLFVCLLDLVPCDLGVPRRGSLQGGIAQSQP